MADWTTNKIDLLRRYWSEGLSASRIAALLGGFSRNAVIGKVTRLKLPKRGRPPSRRAARPVKPSKPTTVKAVALLAPMVPKIAEPPPVKKRARTRLPEEFDNDLFFIQWVANLNPRTSDIFNIPGSFQCKYINGIVGSGTAKWCRKPVKKGSWCGPHRQLVYQPYESRYKKR